MGDVQSVGRVGDRDQFAAVDGFGGAPAADLERHDRVGVAVDDEGRNGESFEVAAEVGLSERRRAVEGALRGTWAIRTIRPAPSGRGGISSALVAQRQRPCRTSRPTSASSASSAKLRTVNRCTCAWDQAGTRPNSISSHCTGVAVRCSVSHTAIPREASHSACSSATTAYHPRTAAVSRGRP